MARLERPGHEARLLQVQRDFKKSFVGSRRSETRGYLKRIVSGAALMVLGAGLGASAFVLVDSIEPPPTSERRAMPHERVFYASCRDAFQDGRANIRQGEPGYRRQLDSDGDGMACEPYLRPRD